MEGIFEGPSPWSIIQKVTACVRRKAVPLFLFVEMNSTLWYERAITPIQVIIQNVEFTGKMFREDITSQKRVERFRKGLEELTKMNNQLLLNVNLDDVRQ